MLSRIEAPDRHPLRRQELREPPPFEAALEEGDAAGGGPDTTSEVDLIRGASAIGLMRPLAIVEGLEVAADEVELGAAADEPEGVADGLLEGAEEPLDPAVRPGGLLPPAVWIIWRMFPTAS